MKRFLIFLCLSALLVGCESVYEQDMHTQNVYEPTYLEVWNLNAVEIDLYLIHSGLRTFRYSLDKNRPKAGYENKWNSVKKEFFELRERYFESKEYINKEYMNRPASSEALNKLADFHIQMKEAEEMIAKYEQQIETIDERFSVDKRRYSLKKEKYREHLLKGIKANNVPKSLIYSDETVVIYIDEIKVKTDSVRIPIRAYIVKPARALNFAGYDTGSYIIDKDNYFRTDGYDTKVSLYNIEGDNLGSPIDVSVEKQGKAGGVVINLTFEEETPLGEGVFRLLIEESTLRNEKEIVMEIPYKLKEVTPPKLPSAVVDSQVVKAERDFVEKIETISCKKEGNHLIVPVSLNIHGLAVEAGFLLDTGASVTTIPMSLYKKGNSKPLSELNKEMFQTAKGALQSYIDNIEISTSAYTKTVTVAISEYDTPLLGANYFENNVFTVDVENECIYVHPISK